MRLIRSVVASLSTALILSCASSAEAQQCLSADALGKRVLIPSGNFMMGENPRYPEEGPSRQVNVQAFEMDVHEVTNAQFSRFAAATGYKTSAERTPPKLPNAPPEMTTPGSATFTIPARPGDSWWTWSIGANWRQPEGPGSSIVGKDFDPVVQISYEDAMAYAAWAGGTLPSEQQWEYAARSGEPALDEPIDEQGKRIANNYQGRFPAQDMGEDGFTGRAPIGCFKPNNFGLYDMIGNVWEWTSTVLSSEDRRNIIKGGSYLCAPNYCARYRPSARQFQELDLGTNHIGFRLVYAVSKPANENERKR